MFRSALPHGERHLRIRQTRKVHSVSIRAPARGATASCQMGGGWPGIRFRSALPHGERLDLRKLGVYVYAVSIRAPARGAT